ncbi:MAG: TIGR02646 family protein [Lachnospiraceae bacterium]|nr:TIGR02646 family protein [Lachnospiraceae bacterium]
MLYIEKGRVPAEVLAKVNDIKRSPEWRSIQEGDTNAVRLQFDMLPKEQIRESLIKEQHGLCAYCMKRIHNNGLSTTIEHFVPLSKDKDSALEYSNMLAVCDGGKNTFVEGKRILCCDACKKDEDEMTVNPLNKYMMDKISYKTNGTIYTEPYDKKIEDDINYILCLNGKLDRNGKTVSDTTTEIILGRKRAYEWCDAFIRKLKDKRKCTSSRIKKKMEEIYNEDERREYAGVILFFLNRKYKELVSRGL